MNSRVGLSEGWGREWVPCKAGACLVGLLCIVASPALPNGLSQIQTQHPAIPARTHKAGNYLEEWDFELGWVNFYSKF